MKMDLEILVFKILLQKRISVAGVTKLNGYMTTANVLTVKFKEESLNTKVQHSKFLFAL